jgi:AcrR family transcriptional regulator
MNNADALIKSSFIQLLQTRPYDKITVSEICRNVGTSRRTFYHYFDGIEDVVTSVIHDDLIAPILKLRSLIPLDDMKSSSLLGLEMSCNILFEKRDFYLKMIDYRGRMSLVEKVAKQFETLNLEIYQKYPIAPEEREFIAYYFGFAGIMSIIWWLENKPELSPKQIAKYLDTWAFAHFREIEDRF